MPDNGQGSKSQPSPTHLTYERCPHLLNGPAPVGRQAEELPRNAQKGDAGRSRTRGGTADLAHRGRERGSRAGRGAGHTATLDALGGSSPGTRHPETGMSTPGNMPDRARTHVLTDARVVLTAALPVTAEPDPDTSLGHEQAAQTRALAQQRGRMGEASRAEASPRPVRDARGRPGHLPRSPTHRKSAAGRTTATVTGSERAGQGGDTCKEHRQLLGDRDVL